VLTLSWTLCSTAALVCARGDPQTAALLCAADEALVDEHGFERNPWLDETTYVVRDALGDRFDDVWTSGADLGLDTAVELAIGALDASADDAHRS